MSPLPMDGVIAVPATPFTDSNLVDEESLRRYVRRSLDHGVVGFLAPAVAGEVETLSRDERSLVVRTILDEVGERVPVIGGATDPDPVTRLVVAKHYLELGCSGILAHIAYEDASAYSAAVRELAVLVPGFLMLQDLDTGPVPVPVLAELARSLPVLKWAKVETGDRCSKCSSLLAATDDLLRVGSAGPDLIELLDRGIHAYLPTLHHDICGRIWSLHRSGRRQDAVNLWRKLLPCLVFMATHQRIQWHFTKKLLEADGIFATARIRISAPEPDRVEDRLIRELAEVVRDLSTGLSANAP